MKIYTLNVNGFRGNEGIDGDVTLEELDRNLKELKYLIDDIICDVDSVIVLQEVPNKKLDKTKQPWEWVDNVYKRIFINIFENEYQIIEPKHLIDSFQWTAALCRQKSRWGEIEQEIIKYDSEYNYGNKIVELQYKNNDKKLSLLGVHMKPVDEMWDLIFDSYKISKHTFVVGDFNAYEERGSMKSKPQQLRNLNFNSCIPSNVITDYKDESSIDNIYMNAGFKLCHNMSVEVKRLVDFKTDHALCKLEIIMD